METFQDLIPPTYKGLIIENTGCLSQCGNGPNVSAEKNAFVIPANAIVLLYEENPQAEDVKNDKSTLVADKNFYVTEFNITN
mgnify:CR=1 FL=1